MKHDISVLIEQGLIHHKAGRLETAQKYYDSILDLDPINYRALHLLGLIEYQRGHLDDSVALISQAILSKPDSAEVHSSCADAYRALHCFKEANTHLQIALSLTPCNAKYLYNLAVLLHENDHLDAAVDHYHRVLEIIPNFAQAHYQLALALNSLEERGCPAKKYRLEDYMPITAASSDHHPIFF